jgi:hypothetical protein
VAILRAVGDGGFVEEHRPLTDEERAPLLARQAPALWPSPGADDGVPAPPARGIGGRARVTANRAFAETVPLVPTRDDDGHDNGYHNGHGTGEYTAAEAAPGGPARLNRGSDSADELAIVASSF